VSETPPPDLSLKPAMKALAKADPDIARHYQTCGLPPERYGDPTFAGLIRTIVSQQVSVASARAILGRLHEALEHQVTAEKLLCLDDAACKQIGLSRHKVRYTRALAEHVLDGRLDPEGMDNFSDDEVIETMTRVPGIGRWTADIYLLFALRRPDVWPAGDLAVREAQRRVKGLAERPTEKQSTEIAEAWRPHRSAAARFMWHAYRHPGLPD